MSAGSFAVKTTEATPVDADTQNHSNVEQNAANMLINMGATNAMIQPTLVHGSPYNRTCNEIKYGINIKKELPIATLPLSAAIILLTQHLCSLDDTSICKEQIELMLNRAKMEIRSSTVRSPSQTFINSGSQLSSMVNLQCSVSKGRVKVITSINSFQNGIYKALRWLHDTFYMSTVSNKKLSIPNFIIILSTPACGPVEFGILVTGVSHAKILAECLGISNIVRSPFEDDIKRLNRQFQQTSDALSSLITMYEEARDGMFYIPFNAYAGMRVCNSRAIEHKPAVAPISAEPPHTKGIFANQAAMAHQLLSQLRNIADNPEILDLASYLKVEILIVVPPTYSLYHQTIKRLCESGLLNDLGLEVEDTVINYDVGSRYVITYSDWPESVSRWNAFVKSTQNSQDTLFLLIFDQAQRYGLPQGMPDVLPNLKEIFESTNVIPVFVTSVPYMFQSRKSFIDPDNEVYWTDARQSAGNLFIYFVMQSHLVNLINTTKLYAVDKYATS